MKKHLDNAAAAKLEEFLARYGSDALCDALRYYENHLQTYLVKSQKTVRRISVGSINYVEIFGHDIVFHTQNGNYKKYGTLEQEFKILKKYGFVKCNQSHLTHVQKIEYIKENRVYLVTGEVLPLSRGCAPAVISAFIAKKPPHS